MNTGCWQPRVRGGMVCQKSCQGLAGGITVVPGIFGVAKTDGLLVPFATSQHNVPRPGFTEGKVDSLEPIRDPEKGLSFYPPGSNTTGI